LQVSAVAPPSAVTMRARFVAQALGTATAIGFRQVKVEQGGLPASLYSEEAALQSTNAALEQEASTRATAVAAEVAARTALEATVTNPATGLAAAHAAVQTNATAQANINGQLSAQYTVKTDVAGLISGYGLASSANNAAPSSAFGVRANSFYIAPPATAQATAPTANLYNGYVWLDTSVNPNVTRYRSGTSWVTTPPTMPFVVQTTPQTLPSGLVVPPGVFMQTAFIQDASITSAKIESLTVDKLAAGSLAVGAYAQSTNYVAGVSGWRLSGDGTSQLPAANILGKLTTGQIEVGSVTVLNAYITSAENLVFTIPSYADSVPASVPQNFVSSGSKVLLHWQFNVAGSIYVGSDATPILVRAYCAVRVDGVVVGQFYESVLATSPFYTDRSYMLSRNLTKLLTLAAGTHSITASVVIERFNNETNSREPLNGGRILSYSHEFFLQENKV
jgi:hypothetical protein